MQNDRKSNRKRSTPPVGGSTFSKSLREARNLIDSGKRHEGLALLNQMAAKTKNPGLRGKLAILLATTEFELSHYIESAGAFSKAGQYARQVGDTGLALRSGIGEVRSLLRALRKDKADAAATVVITDLEKAQHSFEALSNLTPAQLATQGAVTVGARPPRPTVTLTQLANVFLESGYTDEARLLLEKAILLSPNGASRARQVLAKLCLASDQPELAERYAREARQMGRFQAKTIAAWPLYLDARVRQNQSPILEIALYEALKAHSNGRIFSASALNIVRLLRAHRDPFWKTVASNVLAEPIKADLIILTEIKKILHADAKLTLSDNPTTLASRSLQLFNSADVSAREQIAHAKSYIRFTLQAGETPDVEKIIATSKRRFGPDHAALVRHAIALAAALARQHDLARDLLMAIIGESDSSSESWAKATWALARLESQLEGRKAEAGFWYLQIAGNDRQDIRNRFQALLRAVRAMAGSGEFIDLGSTRKSITELLFKSSDYKICLDFGRQLSLAGSAFDDLKQISFLSGTQLALEDL